MIWSRIENIKIFKGIDQGLDRIIEWVEKNRITHLTEKVDVFSEIADKNTLLTYTPATEDDKQIEQGECDDTYATFYIADDNEKLTIISEENSEIIMLEQGECIIV